MSAATKYLADDARLQIQQHQETAEQHSKTNSCKNPITPS